MPKRFLPSHTELDQRLEEAKAAFKITATEKWQEDLDALCYRQEAVGGSPEVAQFRHNFTNYDEVAKRFNLRYSRNYQMFKYWVNKKIVHFLIQHGEA